MNHKDKLIDGKKITKEEKDIVLKNMEHILDSELILIEAKLNEKTSNVGLRLDEEYSKKIKKEILDEIYPQGIEEKISDILVSRMLKTDDLLLELINNGIEIPEDDDVESIMAMPYEIEQFPFEKTTYTIFAFNGFNEIKVSFNVNKILNLFEQKRVKAIKNNPKLGNEYLLTEHLNNNTIGTSKELKEHSKKIIDKRKQDCLSILYDVYQLKKDEVRARASIRHYIDEPINIEEKREFEKIIENIIIEVFGKNTEEYMSDILITVWMRQKEKEKYKI